MMEDGRRSHRPDLMRHGAIDHVAGAGHDGTLVNVQTGAMRMQNFHRVLSDTAGAGFPLRKSKIVLRGCRQPTAQSGVLKNPGSD
jgi:hypothetical protein